jgi:hypothetical protein
LSSNDYSIRWVSIREGVNPILTSLLFPTKTKWSLFIDLRFILSPATGVIIVVHRLPEFNIRYVIKAILKADCVLIIACYVFNLSATRLILL